MYLRLVASRGPARRTRPRHRSARTPLRSLIIAALLAVAGLAAVTWGEAGARIAALLDAPAAAVGADERRDDRRAGPSARFVAAPSAPASERVTGRAAVVDGDTLRIDGRRVRFDSIDAPESDQTCTDASGRAYACGEAATAALRALIDGRRVTCIGPGDDQYGRLIARCDAGDGDLGEAMVRAGHALAYRRFSGDYIPAEDAARAARAGMWAGPFTPPWDHRLEERQVERAAAALGAEAAAKVGGAGAATLAGAEGRAPGCDIKGNISANGRIFHRPGQADYERTRIDVSAGERWFCSEAEAVGAGWRPARR
jgi:endonuclease YncB( thermonuclease family)